MPVQVMLADSTALAKRRFYGIDQLRLFYTAGFHPKQCEPITQIFICGFPEDFVQSWYGL
jgi:hypothetical protein